MTQHPLARWAGGFLQSPRFRSRLARFSLLLVISTLLLISKPAAGADPADESVSVQPPARHISAQWEPAIQQMVNTVNWPGLRTKIFTLQNFRTRHKHTPNQAVVAESLLVFFKRLGLDARFQTFSQPSMGGGRMDAHNVIAEQRGSVYPDSIVIISAHYDSMSETPLSYAPGADDNASGVAAVMTAAGRLSKRYFGYTIWYICFASEEYGGWGSGYFMNRVLAEKTPIMGAINVDMIGYKPRNGNHFLEVESNQASVAFARAVRNAGILYTPASIRIHFEEQGASDNYAFWKYGYNAVNITEEPYPLPGFNPHWHTTTDLVEFLDPEFTMINTRVALAALATLAEWQPAPPKGAIAGQVLADCSTGGSDTKGLDGIIVDVFNSKTGVQAGSDVTNELGEYKFIDLVADEYTLTVVTPLGYAAPGQDITATVTGNQTTNVDMSLDCLNIVPATRGTGFWKHEFTVATGGNGRPHHDKETLCGYLDTIEAHFYNNSTNPVHLYKAPATGACADKLQIGRDLLALKGNVGTTARAKQHFMALLLNVASGRLATREVISEDGATAGQAITRCDHLIGDFNLKNDSLVKTIAEHINEGSLVPGGMIPLNIRDIAYASEAEHTNALDRASLDRIYPNPFNPATTVHYSIPQAAVVRIGVYDIRGRLVETLTSGTATAGNHVAEWHGRDSNGNVVATGIYFVRLASGGYTETRKIVLLK